MSTPNVDLRECCQILSNTLSLLLRFNFALYVTSILRVSMFEKVPLDHILAKNDYNSNQTSDPNQLILIDDNVVTLMNAANNLIGRDNWI